MHDLRPLARRLALAASLILLAGCGQGSSPADHIAKANEFFRAGEYRSASIELANALQKEPDNAEGRWLLARTALRLGEADRAERDVRRAMQLGISADETQPVLVRAMFLQGNFNGVLTETSTPLAAAPDRTRAVLLAYRATALLLSGASMDEAQAIVEEALKIDPETGEALVAMSLVHAMRGDQAQALEWSARAVKLAPESPDAWTMRAELALAAGDLTEAETAFGNAIQHRAYATLDRAKRALARLQLGKLQEAEEDLNQLRRAGFGEHPYVNYVAGLVHLWQDRLQEAANAFEASFAANPSFIPNRLYLAVSRFALGETERALVHARYVHAQAPHSLTATRLLGAVQISQAEYAAARRLLESAVVGAPDDPQLLQMLATTTLYDGDPQTALGRAERLVSIAPDSQQAAETLMLARLMTGEALAPDAPPRTDDAIDDYRTEFLRALEAFRDNRFVDALAGAQSLHERYPDRADPLNLIAAVHLATGNWPAARTEFEKVIAQHPGNDSARLNLARIELQIGDRARVKELLSGLNQAQPENEAAALLLADAERLLGNPAEAVRILNRSLNALPRSVDIRAALARLHRASGAPEEVVAVLRPLTPEQIANRPHLLELRGNAQLAIGDFPAARATFEQWTRLDPNSAPAQFMLAEALIRAGDGAAARSALEQSMALDRQYVPARIGYVRLMTRLGEFDRARTEVASLLEGAGDRLDVLGTAGWFELLTGNFVEAEQHLSRAIAMRADTDLTILRVRALWGQERHDDAIAHLDDWLANHPADQQALLHLAGAYLSLERTDDAIRVYSRVLEQNPGHVPSMNNIAWLSRDRDPEAALKMAQEAYRLAPEDPHVLDTMGMLLLGRGDLVRAHHFVAQAVERSPNDPQIRLHLADILTRQQEWSGARDALESVIRQAPNTPLEAEARSMLETVERGQR